MLVASARLWDRVLHQIPLPYGVEILTTATCSFLFLSLRWLRGRHPDYERERGEWMCKWCRDPSLAPSPARASHFDHSSENAAVQAQPRTSPHRFQPRPIAADLAAAYYQALALVTARNVLAVMDCKARQGKVTAVMVLRLVLSRRYAA